LITVNVSTVIGARLVQFIGVAALRNPMAIVAQISFSRIQYR
jgi:hypothetical protein